MGNEPQARVVETVPLPREIWPEALELPCQIVRGLRSSSFHHSRPSFARVNSLVDTKRREGAHVPVLVNGVMVGWAEFDVIDGRLAIRMTEMV